MNDWPIVDREPVRLPTLPGHDDELWAALIELSDLRPGEWTLIGAQMVFIQAMEHGAQLPRVLTDLDVLVNARVVTGVATTGVRSRRAEPHSRTSGTGWSPVADQSSQLAPDYSVHSWLVRQRTSRRIWIEVGERPGARVACVEWGRLIWPSPKVATG